MIAFQLSYFVVPAKAGIHSGEHTNHPHDTLVLWTGSRIGLQPSGMTSVWRVR
jgi:hypothetical protein